MQRILNSRELKIESGCRFLPLIIPAYLLMTVYILSKHHSPTFSLTRLQCISRLNIRRTDD